MGGCKSRFKDCLQQSKSSCQISQKMYRLLKDLLYI
jgi:hypothetical protein